VTAPKRPTFQDPPLLGVVHRDAKGSLTNAEALRATSAARERVDPVYERMMADRAANEQRLEHFRRLREQQVARSGLPARHIKLAPTIAPASFTGDETLLEQIGVAFECGGIVLVCGNNGVGKTLLATKLAMEWIDGKRAPAKYVDAGLYISQMRHDCFKKGACSEAEWIADETKRTGLLILDEIDKMAELEKTTSSTFIFERIIRARHDAGDRPTLLLANYTEDAAKAHIPASVRDRILDGGLPVGITGESWRRKKNDTPRSPQ